MTQITISTKKKKQVIPITNRINEYLEKAKAKNGICHVFVAHTTCCLTTADLDPGTDEDLLDAVMKIFPKGNYRHPHDPSHVGEHIMSSIIGPSVSVPVEAGQAVMGTWQEVVLVELSGPRTRKIVLNFVPC